MIVMAMLMVFREINMRVFRICQGRFTLADKVVLITDNGNLSKFASQYTTDRCGLYMKINDIGDPAE